MDSKKDWRLNYEITHNKLRRAIAEMKEKGMDMTVSAVAEYAGVSRSTAYKHGCRDLIREALKEK